MKKKFKLRKAFQQVAQTMGIEDTTILTGQVNEMTKKPRYELVNNARRFVKGLLKLPMAEQQRRLGEFNRIIKETEEAAQ